MEQPSPSLSPSLSPPKETALPTWTWWSRPGGRRRGGRERELSSRREGDQIRSGCSWWCSSGETMVVMLIDRMRTENMTMMKSAANAGTEVHVCGMSEHESNLCEEFRSFMRS